MLKIWFKNVSSKSKKGSMKLMGGSIVERNPGHQLNVSATPERDSRSCYNNRLNFQMTAIIIKIALPTPTITIILAMALKTYR